MSGGGYDPRFAQTGGLASALSASRPGPRDAAPPLAGEGVTDAAELARLVQLLRSAEATTQSRDIVIGQFMVAGARVPKQHIAILQDLTRNEAAVLRFLGWGRANADIGTLLDMTENTVRTHMNNAIRKLQLDGVRELNSLGGLLFLPLD